MEKTPEVIKALEHVKLFHPTLHKVYFNEEGQWNYTDKNHNGFTFSDDIDVGILEDAVDSLDVLPIVIVL